VGNWFGKFAEARHEYQTALFSSLFKAQKASGIGWSHAAIQNFNDFWNANAKFRRLQEEEIEEEGLLLAQKHQGELNRSTRRKHGGMQ
jgi:alcohol dehydrogenase YqhD (iron-dependent ADH family)